MKKCVDCGMKTVCRDCAIAKSNKKKDQEKIIKEQKEEIQKLERELQELRAQQIQPKK